jgi:response regulator RpfG family c-di-GMP phosphodiesterase
MTLEKWPFPTPSSANPANWILKKSQSCASTAITDIRCSKKSLSLQEVSEIVYSHQEKYDGTGYPRGLKGEEIPLGARIFSIADTLDAITSNRPYRAAQSLSAAREEIERWSGRQFDPDVVKVFIKMPDNIWEDLRREIDSQVYRFSYSAAGKG